MLRLIFIKVPIVVGLIALSLSAYLSWSSDLLVNEIENQSIVDSIGQFEVDHFPDLVVEPVKLLLFKASSEESVDDRYVVDMLEVYLKRRPFDANAWLIASQFYQRLNNTDLSSQALAVAHRLSEANSSILLKVFNRYLELGLIDQALSVAHDIVYIRPNQFRRLFYLMGRLDENYADVVNKMIPAEVPVARNFQNQLNSDAYFSWALIDAIRADNFGLVQAVWAAMPVEFKKNSKVGVRYINYLVEKQLPLMVEPVWSEVVGSEMRAYELLNHTDLSVLSPCWQVRHIDGVELTLETNVDRAISSLQLTFLGESNIGYSHLSCIVRVEPGEKYILRGRSKGSDITTLSGPFLDVSYPGVDGQHRRSKAMIGSWRWMGFELVLDVPKDVYFAKIRIRRAKTKLLDSKISGRVWFEGLKLEVLQ